MTVETSAQEREWTKWSDQRPPNAEGSYRYRAGFNLLGLPVVAEWEEAMSLVGMGYGDSEYWPLSPCHWDGYKRSITIAGLEWSPVQAYDEPGVLWHGLDLLPCPFTGKPAKVEPQGQYIGAPLWRTEALWLSSPGVPKRRWTDAKAMVAAWNHRAPISNNPVDGEPDPDCPDCHGSGAIETGGDEPHTVFFVACICTAPEPTGASHPDLAGHLAGAIRDAARLNGVGIIDFDKSERMARDILQELSDIKISLKQIGVS